MKKTAWFLLVMFTASCAAAIDGWPEGVREVTYPSSADQSKQPALFYSPDADEPRPLLVGLHTWSSDYKNGHDIPYAKWCVEQGWAFIHPNFRGPNRRPEACGSELAVKDIASAVEWAAKQRPVDRNRIYIVGTSGGGHAALLLAGRLPELWAGVSAWVGISDLRAWHGECRKTGRKYWRDIEASCGGPPGKSAAIDREYSRRSPLTWLEDYRGPAIDINAGIRDGHAGSVPISHSLLAFNRIAGKKDQVAPADILTMTKTARVPEHLRREIKDSTYGKKRPLFRAVSKNARVTIFDGGHECVPGAAFSWLSKQRRQEPKR